MMTLWVYLSGFEMPREMSKHYVSDGALGREYHVC